MRLPVTSKAIAGGRAATSGTDVPLLEIGAFGCPSSPVDRLDWDIVTPTLIHIPDNSIAHGDGNSTG